MRTRPTALAALLLTAATACSAPAPAPVPTPAATGSARLSAQVVQRLPHDPSAFTQGLEIADGTLYEGTGLAGKSEIRATDPQTGAVASRAPLAGDLFGEGITVVDDRIWQLTWTDGVAVERDRATLAERRRVDYAGEGWGLCHDGGRLVMSDGSDALTFRDPLTFAETGRVAVRDDDGAPVRQLNELECVGGQVWANVWQTDRVVRIDPGTGRVTGVAELTGLLSGTERQGTDVLNGIAAIPGTDEFLVTGKLWPAMFRIRFVPAG
ncbi:glutaminyl-peptide cyclotransferase [Actinokineospora sp. PR83]|uniref:glutaminyl-peptide cyclotransferase n=1 Tax=Actinokineospora sp. PR83 TaxID=2884908 RepID=UPI0027E0B4F7|nr:glutaminyl-peptide cyclotransferase [Actinokineospora sp. PR83]